MIDKDKQNLNQDDLVMEVDEADQDKEVITRLQAHQEGRLHRISVVYLIDGKGNILVQERKDGRQDHSSAGHVDIGEDYEKSAYRELLEELGVSEVVLERIAKGMSEEKNDRKEIYVRHYFEMFVGKAEPVKLLEAEVEGVFWADPELVLKNMNENPDSELYAQGFRDSLPLFLQFYRNK